MDTRRREYQENAEEPELKRVVSASVPNMGGQPQQVKEAMEGIGFHLLVVCGYAFDPHLTEETRKFGKLRVLPARMNAAWRWAMTC